MKINFNFKLDRNVSKALGILGIFFVMACFFALLHGPFSQACNWLLMTAHEGHILKAKAVASDPATPALPANSAPKIKIEQLKAPGSTNSSAQAAVSGTTIVYPDFKGIPRLSIDAVAPGTVSTGDVFIYKWAVLGPLLYSQRPPRTSDYCFPESIGISFVGDESKLDGTQQFRGAKWYSFSSTYTNGKIDFAQAFPKIEYAACYALSIINAPEEMQGVALKVSSDDYAKIWVNGENIYTYREKCRGLSWAIDTTVRFTLKKGDNLIIFKCVQITGAWEIAARLIDKDGKSIYLQGKASYAK